MKKTWSRFIFIALLLVSVAADAKVTISKIEYFPGEDFVQLYLQTNQIMPIPDIFYPEKDNLQRLVMRIKDVEVKFSKSHLTFNSPVISEVSVSNQPGYVDIEIRLKDEVNYRVFTNQNGIFMEFPIIKDLTAKAEKVKADIKPLAKEPTPMPAAGYVSVKDFRISEQAPGRVAFEFALTGRPEYRVIPIEDAPVRLAIDLKNTSFRKLQQMVNAGNVKAIRGGYNSPGVFRIVFDLKYLKHYVVEYGNNILRVQFFDSALPTPAENTLAENKSSPVIKPPPPGSADDNPLPAAENRPMTAAENEPVAAAESKPVTMAEDKPATESPEMVRKVKSDQPRETAAKKEFFSAEKARVGGDKKTSDDFIAVEDEKGNPTATFSRQTIEGGQRQYKGEPMDFSFKNADLVNVLKLFSKISGLNIAIDPDVTGKITAEMTQVPWDQALELFLKINGLDMIQEGNILRIGKVEKLASEAEKRRKLRESREQEGPLEVRTFTLSYAKVSEIEPLLKKQLSTRGEIISDMRTNTLIISEVPERIGAIEKLIDTLDSANPQVSIEARIVEASSSYLNTLGVQWGINMAMDSAHGNQTNLVFPSQITTTGVVSQQNQGGYSINLPSSDTAINPTIRFGNIAGTFNLDLALTALQKKGKGRIISAPRATTQNNMPAEITQGNRIPIQTIQNNTVTTQYINAALELKVTPQITARGSVIMTIDLKNDAANFAQTVNGMPTIVTETAKTTVMVMDGGTIVIGGLYKMTEQNSDDGVPLLSKIPILGGLFKRTRRENTQNELLIFLTPRIIK